MKPPTVDRVTNQDDKIDEPPKVLNSHGQQKRSHPNDKKSKSKQREKPIRNASSNGGERKSPIITI